VSFCLSGLDAIYLSLAQGGEEEPRSGAPLAAPPLDQTITVQQRIGKSRDPLAALPLDQTITLQQRIGKSRDPLAAPPLDQTITLHQ
jgi:hypothetical protein